MFMYIWFVTNSMVILLPFQLFIATLTDVDILQCLHDNLPHLPQESPVYRLVLVWQPQGRAYHYPNDISEYADLWRI